MYVWGMKASKTESFHEKAIKKFRKSGDTKKKMQHYVALELIREIKRNNTVIQ